MRRGIAWAALLLPLTGCYVPPAGYGAGAGGYSYAPPSYPGTVIGSGEGFDTGDFYPGYAYNGGAPTIIVEGASVPLAYYGGGWGYYDRYRRFQRAPDHVWHHLENRHPGGFGFRGYGGGFIARPDGPRFGGHHAPHFSGPGRPEFRPEYRPEHRPEFRPNFQPRPGPGPGINGGGQPHWQRFGSQPGMQAPQARQPMAQPAAAAPRPVPPPNAQPHQGGGGGGGGPRHCPPGQKC